MNEGPQGRGRPRPGPVPLVSLLGPAHNPPQGHGCCVAPIPSLSGGGATALCPRQRAVSDDTHHRQFRQKIGERQADPGRQHCSSCSRRQNSPPGGQGVGAALAPSWKAHDQGGSQPRGPKAPTHLRPACTLGDHICPDPGGMCHFRPNWGHLQRSSANSQ